MSRQTIYRWIHKKLDTMIVSGGGKWKYERKTFHYLPLYILFEFLAFACIAVFFKLYEIVTMEGKRIIIIEAPVSSLQLLFQPDFLLPSLKCTTFIP